MKRSLKALIAGSIAMVGVWMGSGAAFASADYSDALVYTSYGYCEASISLQGPNQNYIASTFWNDNTSTFTCHFWIQRGQKDSSNSYLMTNLYAHNIVLGPTAGGVNAWGTGQYWDGPGYRAQACFYMTDNSGWTGATHCTDAI